MAACCPQCVRVFLWLVAQNKVLTSKVRVRRHMATNSCAVCSFEVESINHVLYFCFPALTVWSQLIKPEELQEFLSLSLNE
ncbi:hypothetical protein Goari_023780 [Gossypium aridum]|uniref:Reverse transcriptase zinc-binding domain-containing protein n=1 Tax=Gossypium aridum TaxID=34290 RepID=A0A7J8X4K6_GOSAI|nr:hypothetical protein [Gossypium aridum]